MNAFCDHLFNLRDQALDDAMRARADLTFVLDEGEDHKFAAAMSRVAHAQPYARWWMTVTDEIEHGGMDPMAALTKTRTTARQSLLQNGARRVGAWFDIAQDHAAAEATRRFYHDTAIFNLDTITGTGSATPTITGTPRTDTPPHTAPPPPGPISPTWRPAVGPAPALRPDTGPDTPPATARR
ncbi:hypothetical protein [Actinoallomurus iriomotensis]|uniref:Uncharacterized protein n=1 Tax=Actinoallomurus iriomotensis TaxID=478107 RepID=A0A9W6S5E4_9ACTN|nr:hypothetical protein [Actinoallomurus iriomotensis]GLY86052.1 hypothetical protein Airi02_039810 [Actinoallomurus iriomotensis]